MEQTRLGPIRPGSLQTHLHFRSRYQKVPQATRLHSCQLVLPQNLHLKRHFHQSQYRSHHFTSELSSII